MNMYLSFSSFHQFPPFVPNFYKVRNGAVKMFCAKGFLIPTREMFYNPFDDNPIWRNFLSFT